MTKSRYLVLALAALVAAAAGLWAGLPQGRTVLLAYVASAGNNSVQVVDLASGEIVRKIYSGATPWRLAVSPDRESLWVQHWYSGTTAVIDLRDHEIVQVLPFRGPGTFNSAGDRFLTFDWPSSGLSSVDARTFTRLEERVTEVPQVYDFAPAPSGETLYMVQFDPMAKGPRPRYSYALAYPMAGDPAQAAPASLRTGLSPVAVRALRHDPFLITADSETNGLSLINHNGDGRAVPTCPGPGTVLLSPDEKRMAVSCWRGEGTRQSQVVAYQTNFTTRPWPTITQIATATVDGAVVAGTYSPAGDRLYLVDRTGNRLLEADPKTLNLLREIAVGDLPVDVAVVPVEPRARKRLEAKSRARQKVEAALARLREQARPFHDLSWTEAVASGKESRRLQAFLQPPDRFRLVTEEGSVRLAAGGDTVSVGPDGRFQVYPRQELISIVYALPSLSVEEGVRRLAGDVPGSPWLRAGIAVDVAAEVEQDGLRSLLVGAARPGELVSQLWLDQRSGRPARLIEQLPAFRAGGHGGPPSAGIIETQLRDWKKVQGNVWMPARLERLLDGQLRQEARIENVRVDTGLSGELFDLARLGGSGTLGDPPVSGSRLPYIADWGVHRLPVPLELQTHNLLHGGVAIQYDCPQPCPDLVAPLEAIARQRDFVFVAPFPGMTSRITLTAWEHIEKLDELDLARIVRFVDAYAGKDHPEVESGAPAGQLAKAH